MDDLGIITGLSEFFGIWGWIAFGLILIGLEILVPSTFLLWPGLAALVVGLITLLHGTDNPIWPWQLQWIVFLILTLLTAFFGRRIMAKRGWDKSEAPQLNERGQQLIGMTSVLSDPIVNGQGRLRIGDTIWRIKGEDTDAGTKVKVVGTKGSSLFVETA